MIEQLYDRNGLSGQIVRYAVSGGALTALYSAIYWTAAVPIGIDALVANFMAFLATVICGYFIHSRWSFRGHGSRDRPARSGLFFLAVNLAGFALNSFWVWLFVKHWELAPSWPLLPIIFVTPWISFYLNRRWTFGE